QHHEIAGVLIAVKCGFLAGVRATFFLDLVKIKYRLLQINSSLKDSQGPDDVGYSGQVKPESLRGQIDLGCTLRRRSGDIGKQRAQFFPSLTARVHLVVTLQQDAKIVPQRTINGS